MSNFDKKLEEKTEEELKLGIDTHSPAYAQLESDELTRRHLRGLRKSIRIFNRRSSEESGEMMKMTKNMTVLTFILTIFAFVQFAVQLWQITFSLQQDGFSWINIFYLILLMGLILWIFKNGEKLHVKLFPEK